MNASRTDDDWDAIGSSVGFNALIALVFLSIYYFLQDRLPQIYTPKDSRTSFFTRFWIAVSESETNLLNRIGLDAYILIRYCRLCARFCLFGSFVGFVVLFPTYGSAKGDASNVFKYSASNLIDMGSNDNVSQASKFGGVRIWIVIIVTWVLTLWFLYDMNMEYKLFVKLRQEFLMNAKDQSRYSILVENIPIALRRSDKALRVFFETLFPEQIHSACVCLRLDKLHDLIEKRNRVTSSEEKVKLTREIDILRKTHNDRLTSIRKQESKDRHGPLSDVIGLVVKTTDSLARSFGESETKLEDVSTTKLEYDSESDISSPLLTHELESEEELREVTPYVSMGESKEEKEEDDEEEELPWYRRVLKACWRFLVFTGEDVVGRSAATIAHRTAVGLNSVVTITEDLALSSSQCSTGFVTFKRLQDASAASQILLVPMPEALKCTLAPQRGDVIWSNVTVPSPQIQTRTTTMEIILALCVRGVRVRSARISFIRHLHIALIHVAYTTHNNATRILRNTQLALRARTQVLLWSFPVTFIYSLGSLDSLSKVLPFLKDFEGSSMYTSVQAWLPQTLLLGVLSLLPTLLDAISIGWERTKLRSQIQEKTFSRYFNFQLSNIYVTVLVGSILEDLRGMIDHPQQILETLASSIPKVAVYFCGVVITKSTGGLALELLDVGNVLKKGFSKVCSLLCSRCCWLCGRKREEDSDEEEEEEKQEEKEEDIDTTPRYAQIYGDLLLALLIALTYAVLFPLTTPFAFLYFSGAYFVWRYKAMYVHKVQYESGGKMFYLVFKRTMVGVYLAVGVTVTYLLTKRPTMSPFLLPLLIIVYAFESYCDRVYAVPSQYLSRMLAVKSDRDAVKNNKSDEEESKRKDDLFVDTFYRQPELLIRRDTPTSSK